MCFYHRRTDISIKDILRSVEVRIVVYTFLMQIMTAFVLTLSEDSDFYTVSLVILNCSIALLAVLLVYFYLLNYERKGNEEDDDVLVDKRPMETYKHPLESVKEFD